MVWGREEEEEEEEGGAESILEVHLFLFLKGKPKGNRERTGSIYGRVRVHISGRPRGVTCVRGKSLSPARPDAPR